MTDQTIAPLVFTADLGGTNLRAALVDERGNIHSRLKHETPRGEHPETIVRAISEAVNALTSSPDNIQLTGAAIMVPGTVNKDQTAIIQAPNLPSFDGFALKSVLETELSMPVVLENDANAAAVGEMWLGGARGCRNVICITLGTGVGGGIILDGKLWRGTDGSAGEIGHTTVEPFGQGLACKCGNTGCLELFASATAVVRMAREGLDHDARSTLTRDGLTAAQVYEAATRDDELAVAIFDKMGRYLGVGIANLITLLCPEVIVIGGGVANAWNMFEKKMFAQVKARVFPSQAANVKITRAECGDNAGLLGAARLAFDQRN